MAALPAIMDGRLRKYLRRNRILFVVSVIARQTANLVSRLLIRTEPPSCDTCAFVEFFRSNGDGQVSRLNTFCRCAGGLIGALCLRPASVRAGSAPSFRQQSPMWVIRH